VLVISAGCGKKEPPAATVETKEYQEWKGSQAIRQLVGGVPGDRIAGSVTVCFPQDRSRQADDFIELLLNGEEVQRTRIRTAGGAAAPLTLQISLRPGADWLDLWDSTTNRNYRFQIDTRQGTDFVLTPSAAGYDISWTKREN
jgi:hypothetical protein